MDRTLVLDAGWQPINAVPWQKAMSYVVRERADVLEEYTGSHVHSQIAMPAVVRLRHQHQRTKQKVKFSRVNILARDHSTCQYCGRRLPAAELTFDHVVPRAQGGKTVWENIVMACIPCNAAKANRTPAEADMRLRRRPERPLWVASYNPRLRVPLRDVPEEWKPYWTTELDP